MIDNISTIIKHHQDKKEEPAEKELNIQLEENKQIKVTKDKQIIKDYDLQITNFSNWFNKHYNDFFNINYIDINIHGIDKLETIILTIPEHNDPEKRKLKIINNANIIPVLNYKPIEINFYNNGFSISYIFINENKLLRCYGVKKGLIITHCLLLNEFENCPIPYNIEKINKKEKGINFKSIDSNIIKEKVESEINFEDIVLLYPQLLKENVKFKTNLEAIKWFNKRREDILDINHLLKIDNIIIKICEIK